MNYWGLFRQAWSITRRNRPLWVFGVLPIVVAYALSYTLQSGGQFPSTDLSGSLGDLARVVLHGADWTSLVAVGLATSLITFVVAGFAGAAMISMVDRAASGMSLSVNDGTQAGTRRLAPLLVVRLLLALPLILLTVIVAGAGLSAVIAQPANPSGDLPETLNAFGAVFALSCLTILISIVMGAVGIGAERAVVLNDAAALPAVIYGWNLLRTRLRDFIGIAVLFVLIGFPIATLLACTVLPIVGATSPTSLATGNFPICNTDRRDSHWCSSTLFWALC